MIHIKEKVLELRHVLKAKSRIKQATQSGDSKSLDFSDLGLTSKDLKKLTPMILKKTPGLMSLDLTNNHLDELPIGLNDFKNLSNIYIDGNNFKQGTEAGKERTILVLKTINKNSKNGLENWVQEHIRTTISRRKREYNR